MNMDAWYADEQDEEVGLEREETWETGLQLELH